MIENVDEREETTGKAVMIREIEMEIRVSIETIVKHGTMVGRQTRCETRWEPLQEKA